MYIQHPLIKPEVIEQREYQVNISKSCVERSTLVVLPTGMGKTICALLVIVDRLQKFPESKVIFMAPTKPLVEQHKAFINDFLLLDQDKTTLFTGEVSPKKRTEQWKNSQVIVSTPQVIENDLLAGRIKLDDISLIIFDEAHRAVGNYAYVFVSEKYQEQGSDQLVMGITASPGSKTEKIMEVCDNLNISGVEIRSEYDPDVLPYMHDININWLRVEVPEKIKLVIKQLRNILEDKCKALYKFGLVRRYRNISTTELLDAQKRIQKRMATGKKQPHSLFFAATVQAAAIKINHAIELAETQGPSALRHYLERLEVEANSRGGSRAARSLLKDKNLQRAIKLANSIEFEHPKLKSVAKIVQNQVIQKQDSRIIVFTHYRDTSELVVKELARLPGVRPVRFVGQASHGADKGLSQKQQVALIEKFKAGEHNILVATSVAEEGLDIPATDLVVFYEPIPSEIRTIQRRGRTGRKRPGKVVILITKQTRDEAYYWSSRSKEKRMKNELEVLRAKLSEKLTVCKPKAPFQTPKLMDIEVPVPQESPQKLPPKAPQESPQNSPQESAQDLPRELPNTQSGAPVQKNDTANMESENTNIEVETKNSNVLLDCPDNVKAISEDIISEGQTRLVDFQAVQRTEAAPIPEAEKKLKIIVDHREFKSLVVRNLAKREIIIEPEQLPVGDYIISDRICVERKLVKDFLQSIIDGRLFKQLKKIKQEYPSPIMILEGSGLFASRKINSSAIYGALVSIISDFNVPLISTADAQESAEIIRAIALREQLDEDRIPGIRGEKGPMTALERQQFIIESLPGISATLAQRLLEQFGSVKAVLMAEVEELTKVKGIGRKTAEDIKKIIEKKYE